MDSIRQWLLHLGHVLRISGRTLAYGRQPDYDSCGFYAMNMIAHALVGDTLLSRNNAAVGRARFFNDIAAYYLYQLKDCDQKKVSELDMAASTVQEDALDCFSITSLATACALPLPEIPDALSSVPSDQSSPSIPFLSLPPPSSALSSPVSVSLLELDQKGDPEPTSSPRPPSPVTCSPADDDMAKESTDPKPAVANIFKLGFRDLGKGPVKAQKKKRKAEDDIDDGKLTKFTRPAGQSKSAVNDREALAAAKSGTFIISRKREQSWQEKILLIDPAAEFIPDNVIDVICSACRAKVRQKTVYNTSNFSAHFLNPKKCKPKKNTSRTLHQFASADAWSTRQPASSSSKPFAPKVREEYCPGLSELDNVRVLKYLGRTMVCGGGARSIVMISKEMFGVTFSKLKKKQKRKVLEAQIDEHRWRNDHRRKRVFSTKCAQRVTVSGAARILPCRECRGLFGDHNFQRTLSKNGCSDENARFINHKFRLDITLSDQYARCAGLTELLQSGNAEPFLAYARGVASGKYRDNRILSGLMESVVQTEERSLRGKGNQNFKWPAEWDNFMHVASIKSTAAYNHLSKVLPARSKRSHQ